MTPRYAGGTNAAGTGYAATGGASIFFLLAQSTGLQALCLLIYRILLAIDEKTERLKMRAQADEKEKDGVEPSVNFSS